MNKHLRIKITRLILDYKWKPRHNSHDHNLQLETIAEVIDDWLKGEKYEW